MFFTCGKKTCVLRLQAALRPTHPHGRLSHCSSLKDGRRPSGETVCGVGGVRWGRSGYVSKPRAILVATPRAKQLAGYFGKQRCKCIYFFAEPQRRPCQSTMEVRIKYSTLEVANSKFRQNNCERGPTKDPDGVRGSRRVSV